MQDDSHRILHIRIRDLRRSRELTQEELAEALGISRQSINAMEAGRCLPSLPVALQLATYFSVPLQELFELEQSLNQAVAQAEAQKSDLFTSLLPVPLDSPRANLYQQGQTLVVEMPLPGYRLDQLHLEVGDDFLTVSGEAQPLPEQARFLLQEYYFGAFRRVFPLPIQVNRDLTEADFTNGLLRIRLWPIVPSQSQTATITIKGA